jgi:LemA protein
MTIALAIIGGVLLVGLLWVVVNYNRMARVRQHILESWSDIDVELKRRYELIPNLVETVKGYARHEREVLEEVTGLRRRAMASRGSAASQAVDESAMLLNFLALQRELSITEDRIAAARRFYNANVREMSQLCETFPTNLLASAFNFEGGDYFELERAAERIVPHIDL